MMKCTNCGRQHSKRSKAELACIIELAAKQLRQDIAAAGGLKAYQAQLKASR